ncbi:MAG: PspC domain-containing protein [Chlorobi bacterium]|nr:PspC domain-containing protein [Chlorobiota bacterium]
MKKAISIHIGSRIFNTDEDAYRVLNDWLTRIEKKYEAEKDGEEILKDIELRVAELFEEATGNNGIITTAEVENIIKIMGNPEDFDNETQNEETKTAAGQKNETKRKQKRLYRDEENKVIAGICAGLGSYFGTDPVIIRLLFIAAFVIGGFGPLLYIILWIAVPKAVTVSQKLEMKGEPVTVSNIEKAVRKEIEYIKNNFFKSEKH